MSTTGGPPPPRGGSSAVTPPGGKSPAVTPPGGTSPAVTPPGGKSPAVTPSAGSSAILASAANATPVVRSRRSRLTIQRVDPWTVLRLAFLLSVAVAVITVVAGLLLWGLLAAGGVFGSVDRTLEDVLGDGAVTVTQYFGFGKVLSISLLIAAIDVVLITALATIGAFLFNLTASLAGGLEVTVTEDS